MPLREMDKIVYPVCTLCRDHERDRFIHGVQVGMRLVAELDVRLSIHQSQNRPHQQETAEQMNMRKPFPDINIILLQTAFPITSTQKILFKIPFWNLL